MNSLYRPPKTPPERKDSISPLPLESPPPLSLRQSSLPPALGSSNVTCAERTYFNTTSKFSEFPSRVIKNILWNVDANSFASLCILNRKWYKEAQAVELYAHHLSRCPSYALANAVITGPFRHNDLYRFKTRFATEVRRNLFDAYTHPRKTFINLLSINANSSAAFPRGEAFRFEFSPNGRTILALSSSRIYVLDATTDSMVVKRELKTTRKPLSASITDDGTLLAVLSSKFQANVYGLPPHGRVQHLQVIVLDNSPRTIAIAHEGTVLAAAYETGVEVFSLAANALSTDRRAVRSEAVDTLTFSGDGSMLVGSSLSLDEPNAVVISAPFYTENDPDLSPREMHSRMWTTQILFPQISSVCSHISLLPGHNEGDATWLFAYDHSLLSYRAVRTDDTRSGVTYFQNPTTGRRFSMPSPTIAPTASMCGTLAIAGFGGLGLCLYGIPEKLDITPDMGTVVERHERRMQTAGPLTTATGNMEPLMAYSPSVSGHSEEIEDDALASRVDWRQSVFVKCKTIESIRGHVAARWVEKPDNIHSGFRGKRLLVVAPGGVNSEALDLGDEAMPIDGSRICLLDFDYAPSSHQDREITIEVGDNVPELLIEHTGSLATEVAMERRRTIRAMPSNENTRIQLSRSITSISPPQTPYFGIAPKRGSVSSPSSPVDGPSSPRLDAANTGIQRSSTVAGFRHALYPPRPPIGSQTYDRDGRPQQGARRASADSWETPPPPYTSGGSGTSPAASPPVMGAQPQSSIIPPIQNNNLHQPGLQGPQSVQPPPQQMYMPYRAFNPRTSTTMDGMPNTESGPTRRTMSQYGALARNRRRDPSLTSLDTVSEAPFHRHGVRSVNLTASSLSGVSSPGDDQYYARPRPLTHHGGSSVSSPDIHSAINSIPPFVSGQQMPNLQRGGGHEAPRQISLTGTNLQNRLNHPVPPVPENIPRVPQMPEEYRQPIQNISPVARQTQYNAIPVTQATQQENDYPVMPTPDQTARLNHRHSQSYDRGVPAPYPLNTGGSPNQDHNRVPPSPPRAAWGAAGVPGSPSFHQARNMPNGLVLGQSHDIPPHVLGASASTPNLVGRPPYGRLNTIDSIGENQDISAPRMIARTQSVIYTDAREQSAYQETMRVTSGLSKGKGKKKKKEGSSSGEKKQSRCIVM